MGNAAPEGVEYACVKMLQTRDGVPDGRRQASDKSRLHVARIGYCSSQTAH